MHINFVASALLLLLSLSAPEATVAQQDDPCLPLGCAECISNATCNWFVCSEGQDMTGCHSAEGAGAGAEGCHPVIVVTECEAPSTTTAEPPASTTLFPTTTDAPSTTTETPETTTNPPETTTTTAPDTTTNPPDTTTTTAPDTTTNPPDTTTTTAPDTTTNPPDTTTTDTPETTTGAPETTTDGPPPPAPTPSPPQPRSSGFSFGSFFGGMVFCLVIVAGVFVGLKIYRRRQAMGGNYNNL